MKYLAEGFSKGGPCCLCSEQRRGNSETRVDAGLESYPGAMRMSREVQGQDVGLARRLVLRTRQS